MQTIKETSTGTLNQFHLHYPDVEIDAENFQKEIYEFLSSEDITFDYENAPESWYGFFTFKGNVHIIIGEGEFSSDAEYTSFELEQKNVLDITREDIESFVEKNIKGKSYKGSFRPYHVIFIYPKEIGNPLELFKTSCEIYDAILPSSNSWTNYEGFEVWNNGDEGCFDFQTLGENSFVECNCHYYGDVDTPESWDALDVDEKILWVETNNPEYLVELGAGIWDNVLCDSIIHCILDQISEEGWEISEE